MNTLDNVKKKDEIKYNNWNAHLSNTRERTNYAIRRMDLLIISICGGSLYLIFETLKAISSKELITEDILLLKFSGVLFLISITANFVSQKTGYFANNNEEKFTLLEITRIEGKEIDECLQIECDKKSKAFTKATNVLNWIAISLMFFGLALLAYFNYSLF